MSITDRVPAAQGKKRKRHEKDSHQEKSQSDSAPQKITDGTASLDTTHAAQAGTNGSAESASRKEGSVKKEKRWKKNGLPNKAAHNPLAARRNALQQVRQKLPIWPRASDIRQRLVNNDVLVLTAETGSGKSTQVPQFLLQSSWCSGRIAVTQPRRVAAVSLARRVAEEMGSPLGKSSPTAQVGYSVRFDDNVGKSNKVKFLTEGMLLQEMLRDPSLVEYSCVIVDEVHERSVNVDLILGFLRGFVTGTSEAAKKRQGKPLKVVIMSATADTGALINFFQEGYKESGKALASSNGASDSGSLQMETESKDKQSVGQNESDMLISVKGRQHSVQTIYLPEPTRDFLEAALLRIFEIHRKEPMPGDILVFLTGQDAVLDLQRTVEETVPAVITLDSGLPKVGVFLVLF